MKAGEYLERARKIAGFVWMINPHMKDSDGDPVMAYVRESFVPAFEATGYALYQHGQPVFDGIPPEAKQGQQQPEHRARGRKPQKQGTQKTNA